MSLPKRAQTLRRACLFAALFLSFAISALAQSAGSLRGEVLDPGGAVVPGATVTLTHDSAIYTTHSISDGTYTFSSVPAGSYTLTVDAPDFAPFSKADVSVAPEKPQHLNITLAVAVQQQSVTVKSDRGGVSVNPDENASATVLKDSDLNALSDDPDQLQSELQALAGPSAGPDGGEIYVDGFTGGQIPPKSSIREIRVNQNPFSAEFDRLGYGRVEILTKPGSDKFKGQIFDQGMDSALNTGNPLVKNQPPYYANFLWANIDGPINKSASYFVNAGRWLRGNQNIINAYNPNGTVRTQAVPNPLSGYWIDARTDLQLGKSNTLTMSESYSTFTAHNSGVGGLNLPAQGLDRSNNEFDLQLGDTVVVNQHLINETRFQWRRVRNTQTAQNTSTAQIVEGTFTDGGNTIGALRDHQDVFEFQNNSTATAGKHTMRFGTRVRIYRDANYSTAGQNGTKTYNTLAHYNAGTPDETSTTTINDPRAHVLLYDGALFYQDDWRWKPNLTLSYGLRFETQDGIHDHADWAPRFAIAWAPMHPGQTSRTKTVFRAGYGWFYSRFNVNTGFYSAGNGGVPYLIQTIHNNGVNQQTTVTNPGTPAVPEIYTIDPHFHAGLSMQGGVGVDHQFSKFLTGNVSYLYTHGVHQFLTNNITAPAFNPSTYTITGPTPAVYNYQYQSGGVFTEHQIIVSAGVHTKQISLNSNYTFSTANSDTQGVGSFPSVAADPGLDYGRATFGIRNRFLIIGSYSAPHGIVIAPFLIAQSGTPYNITIGNDLTGNNQFNARPTYGTCGAANVVSTSYGCLDTNPAAAGKSEPIIPYNLGTGPANFMMHLRVSKVFGIGPRIKSATGANGNQGNGDVSSRGLSGGQAQIKFDATVPRRYSLTLIAAGLNIFNFVNYAPPNGVLSSPAFGRSQALAGGDYSLPVPGNRVIFLQALFSF
jgi:hypothetical protein